MEKAHVFMLYLPYLQVFRGLRDVVHLTRVAQSRLADALGVEALGDTGAVAGLPETLLRCGLLSEICCLVCWLAVLFVGDWGVRGEVGGCWVRFVSDLGWFWGRIWDPALAGDKVAGL